MVSSPACSRPLKRGQQRMPIAERIEAILGLGDQFVQPRPAARARRVAGQLAVVAVGQTWSPRKNTRPPPCFEIRVQHAGFAGGELADVAQKHAVVAAQVALEQRAFGNRPQAGRLPRRSPADSSGSSANAR